MNNLLAIQTSWRTDEVGYAPQPTLSPRSRLPVGWMTLFSSTTHAPCPQTEAAR